MKYSLAFVLGAIAMLTVQCAVLLHGINGLTDPIDFSGTCISEFRGAIAWEDLTPHAYWKCDTLKD